MWRYNPEIFSSEDFEVTKVTEEDETVLEDPEEGSDVVPAGVTSMEVSAIELSIGIAEEQMEENFNESSRVA